MRMLLAALAVTLLSAAPVSAHPHVYVDVETDIVFDTDLSVGSVRHRWRFDAAFSAYASDGLDADGDGTLSRAELQGLAKINIESLSEYGFFTALWAEGRKAEFAAPTDYWLDSDRGVLTLHFTLPLAPPLAVTAPVELTIHDPDYFVTFALKDTGAVRLVDAPSRCTLSVTPARELDMGAATALSEIGPEQRALPDELKALTEGTANTAVVDCT